MGKKISHSYTGQAKLTNIGSDGNLSGDLASGWEGTNGAKTWTFELRNAEFHNGRKISASDVIASLNHHRGESTTSAAKPLLESVKSIKADGEKVVVVELETGNADFPFALTDYHLSIGMDSGNGTVDWKDSGAQAGPYKLIEFHRYQK